MSDQRQNHQKLAMENCCAQQVVHSMFEHVADQGLENLEYRSDRKEIARFSSSLIESEFIFGSPNDDVLETIQQKIIASQRKREYPEQD